MVFGFRSSIYRKTAKPVVDYDDLERAQRGKEQVEAFFRRNFHNPDEHATLKGAYWPFEHSDEFEGLLEQHLLRIPLNVTGYSGDRDCPFHPVLTGGVFVS